MVHKLAIVNPKGGVGKTTTVVNLAAFFTATGHSSLIIDLDPQASATRNFGFNINKTNLSRKKLYYLIKKTRILGCDLMSLSGCEIKSENKLSSLFPAVSRIPYEYILIDCPPVFDMRTENALKFCDKVLIPVQCDYFALESLPRLLEKLKGYKIKIVLTMFDSRNKLAKEVVNKIKKKYKNILLETIIPRNVQLAEAPQKRKSILQYSPRSQGARAYKKLSTEIIDKNK